MDFPDTHSVHIHLDGLLQPSRDVAVTFVFIELQTGLSSCRIVRDSHFMTQETKAWHLAFAQTALRVAETARCRLKMAHPEFDQMMALTERLRFELRELQTG
jgi:hypothetical protein